ncbi:MULTISPECIES: hypothetical protein [Thermomonospora]|uniref:Uncharacterized protein n=1 Tax=Thermomonospora curvata (strain ATCC 19995 / DSM 43183 / JCM 3096 / KCTC 9072 / NBRC 15933 / NCIMB 10081 / Henssen B9) TaxID=471852 RepID=D1AE30_THECD|nr:MULTISPECIES: hypothetical protein [Thermomonospora]ACY99456.1 hypothetical protein Tcur_3927 [Thermomonospora curvata DSM 43183]
MRRIVAVAATSGALVAGIGAFATPAQASPADTTVAVSGASSEAASIETAAKKKKKKKWKPINAFANVSASGTYVRNKKKVTIRGVLTDGKRDGWSACVRFRATKGKKRQYWRGVLRYSTGRYVDTKASARFTWTTKYTGHLWVQECRRNVKTGKYQYANKKWRKLY